MRLLAIVLAAAQAPGANAHGGEPSAHHDFWLAWNTEPWLLAVLAIAAALYALGAHTLWRGSGSGRGLPQWRAGAFCGGWLALLLALVSPLDALGQRSFALHMVQHELLMLVAAPLLVLGRPLAVWAWALPPAALKIAAAGLRADGWRIFWRRLTAPATAWSLHAAALWAWHAPGLFQAGLQSEAVHVLQHASFLVSALLFWWAVLRGRASGMAVLYVFTTLLHTGFLGALITFAPTVWYPAYVETVHAWGLTALEDQQLGGLIMWVPAGAILMLAGLALLAQWLLQTGERPRLATQVRRQRVRAANYPPSCRGVSSLIPNPTPGGRRERLASLSPRGERSEGGEADRGWGRVHGKGTVVSPAALGRLGIVAMLAALDGCGGHAPPDAGGDAQRGADAIRRYGCGACHRIPGIAAADGNVGPPLAGIARRVYLAGVLANTPENMIRWIQVPQEIAPQTAMPDMHVTTGDARDIAAYLYRN